MLTCSGLESQSSQSPQAASALTNKDILELLKAGLSQEIVIAKIKSSACDFDTSPDGLKQLKAANVPDSVILAMVQAPSKQGETSAQRPSLTLDDVKSTKPTASTRMPAPAGVGYVDCGKLQEVPVHFTPIAGSTYVVAVLKCGEQVSVIDQGNTWTKIRTKGNAEGYVPHEFISAQLPKPVAPATQTKPPASSAAPVPETTFAQARPVATHSALARESSYRVTYDGGSLGNVKVGTSVRLSIGQNQVQLMNGNTEVATIPASAITEISYGQEPSDRARARGPAVAVRSVRGD